MTLTFIDAGVLIAAMRGGVMQQQALAVLTDPSRTFASSLFVMLEVLPKPVYYKHTNEAAFYQAFFSNAVTVWATCDEALVQATGLAALDALHVAAARRVGAEELVTSEGPTKPLQRARDLNVVTIQV
jgi:predicted nucleic acid-binding protein